MNKAPHLLSISEQTKKEYEQLKEVFGEYDCERWFGGYTGLMGIIKDKGLQDLHDWLYAPAPFYMD